MNREYKELGSEFRRRVCLRDMVMMELIFFHKIEISQLLQMEVSDYQQDGGTLRYGKSGGRQSYPPVFSGAYPENGALAGRAEGLPA